VILWIFSAAPVINPGVFFNQFTCRLVAPGKPVTAGMVDRKNWSEYNAFSEFQSIIAGLARSRHVDLTTLTDHLLFQIISLSGTDIEAVK
jgi:hypothetical protein